MNELYFLPFTDRNVGEDFKSSNKVSERLDVKQECKIFVLLLQICHNNLIPKKNILVIIISLLKKTAVIRSH